MEFITLLADLFVNMVVSGKALIGLLLIKLIDVLPKLPAYIHKTVDFIRHHV